MSNRVSQNNNPSSVDRNLQAGDSFTSGDSSSPANTTDEALALNDGTSKPSLLDNPTTANAANATKTGPNSPSSAGDRREARQKLGLKGTFTKSSSSPPSPAGEATAIAARGELEDSSGPFSGKEPANKKFKYVS